MEKIITSCKELQYRVESVGKKVDETSEKTFCFSCGCFQGGGNNPILGN